MAKKAAPMIDDTPSPYSPEVDRLIAKGKEQGFVTQQEIAAVLPEAEENLEELDELYAALLEQGVEITDQKESRGTTLVQNNASVSTIEHVLAAFNGLRVDNALIELNGPEAPIMGGSSWRFVEAIKEAGIIEQKEDRNYFVVKQKITFSDERNR